MRGMSWTGARPIHFVINVKIEITLTPYDAAVFRSNLQLVMHVTQTENLISASL